MALITESTFHPLQNYVKVRLQQGVPILDADWNEQDDVRQFELRAYLKWFVQDGIPEGNDGFRIEGAGEVDNFWIRQGLPAPPSGTDEPTRALRHVGRCLVDGMDVMITEDLRYTEQPLHQSQADSAALAAKLRTRVVPPLDAPAAGPLLVYLDVWEVELSAAEEPKLVLKGLGIETCGRVKRNWAVRVRPGAKLPGPGDSDFLAGHSTLELAVIGARTGNAVRAQDVTDLRQQRLLVPPAHLVEDTLGVTARTYRRGQERPPISLREAVNALLAGELPGSDSLPVARAPGADVARRAFVADARGGLVAVWQSVRTGTNQIHASRLDLTKLDAGFSPAVAVTAATEHVSPTAVALPNGDVVVAYQTGPSGSPSTDIAMKRGAFSQLATVAETKVVATPNQSDERPLAIVLDGTVVFFSFVRASTAASTGWSYRRYGIADASFIDTAPQLLRPSAAPTTDLHAAPSPAGGTVWLAYVDAGEVKALAFQPADGGIDAETSVPANNARELFVLAERGDEASVFWTQGDVGALQVMRMRCVNNAWGPAERIATIENETEPSAAIDSSGRLWLFTVAASTELHVRTQQPETGDFNQPRTVARVPRRSFANPAVNPRLLSPYPIFVGGQGIWLFWTAGAGDLDLFAKRLITSL